MKERKNLLWAVQPTDMHEIETTEFDGNAADMKLIRVTGVYSTL